LPKRRVILSFDKCGGLVFALFMELKNRGEKIGGHSLSVRYFSARSGSVPGYDAGEGLKFELPSLSPLSVRFCLRRGRKSRRCPELRDLFSAADLPAHFGSASVMPPSGQFPPTSTPLLRPIQFA
jgi:hypothetical protein